MIVGFRKDLIPRDRLPWAKSLSEVRHAPWAEGLATLTLRMKGNRLTELSSLADVQQCYGPVTNKRQNGQPQVTDPASWAAC